MAHLLKLIEQMFAIDCPIEIQMFILGINKNLPGK